MPPEDLTFRRLRTYAWESGVYLRRNTQKAAGSPHAHMHTHFSTHTKAHRLASSPSRFLRHYMFGSSICPISDMNIWS